MPRTDVGLADLWDLLINAGAQVYLEETADGQQTGGEALRLGPDHWLVTNDSEDDLHGYSRYYDVRPRDDLEATFGNRKMRAITTKEAGRGSRR
jgi:hypothetical protein